MALPDVADLDPMPEPFELLELRDGEHIDLRIERHELGKATIHPRDGRPARTIQVLRVYVPDADKPTLPRYWDVTSKHLASALLGYLDGGHGAGRTFRVTWHGKGPAGRPTLEVLPA